MSIKDFFITSREQITLLQEHNTSLLKENKELIKSNKKLEKLLKLKKAQIKNEVLRYVSKALLAKLDK